MTAYDLLQARYFSSSTKIGYSPNLEGQFIDENNVIWIGDRAGPEIDVSHLIHEMCHFVEIDDVRMREPGWGLKVPRVWVFDRYCIEPTTIQMTERELRVMAYQFNVMQFLKLGVTPLELAKPLRWLPDNTYVPLEDGTRAWSENGPKLNYAQTCKSQVRWMANQISELSRVFTLERFESEWNRKVQLL